MMAEKKPQDGFLKEDDSWAKPYFLDGFKSRRREMFFKPGSPNWTAGAARDSDEEPVRPPKKRKKH